MAPVASSMVSAGVDEAMLNTSLRLTDKELLVLRNIVKEKYINALLNAGIQRYGDHAAIFTKWQRLFRVDDVAVVKHMGFYADIRGMLGPFTLSDVVVDGVVQPGREEVYWRIVRPNCPDDVGPAHCDREFHERDGMHFGKETVKIWIPLWCETGCGLHIFDVGVFSGPGTILMFGPDMLHQGMVNTATTARVSMEMTAVLG